MRELLKLVNGQELLAQLIVFCTVFFLLQRFAWKPILTFLDARKQKIAADLAMAEQQRQQAQQDREEYQRRLAHVAEDAKIKIQAMLDDAKQASEEMKKKAALDAQRIMDSAREEIQYELGRAKEEIKEQIVDLSLKSIEHIVQEKFTVDQDRKLVADFLEQIKGLK